MQEETLEKRCYNSHIRQYFTGLLSGYRFRELEYLKIYPFISELQDEALYKGHILREKIDEINNILNGEKKFSYNLWMSLGNCDISRICSIWDEYKENGTITFKQLKLLEEELLSIQINIKTVQDLYREKLLTLLTRLPTSEDFYTYNLLYTEEVDENNICREVEQLIDILKGKRPVHMLLRYGCKGPMYTIL